jgi:uncharacterized membrane protein YkvA (DUF1232 family)
MSLDHTPGQQLLESLEHPDIKARLHEPRTEDTIKEGFADAVGKIKHQVAHLWDDLHDAYRMLFDGEFDVQGKYKLALIGAFAYLVSPVDLIPEFIPVIGLADDIAVITLALRFCAPEIARYRAFIADKPGEPAV